MGVAREGFAGWAILRLLIVVWVFGFSAVLDIWFSGFYLWWVVWFCGGLGYGCLLGLIVGLVVFCLWWLWCHRLVAGLVKISCWGGA